MNCPVSLTIFSALLAASNLAAQISPTPGSGIEQEIRPASAETIAIINGTVVDPSAAKPETSATVLIDGRKIVAVGPSLDIPKGARIIDAKDKYLVPGLWDMHAHLAALTPIGVAPEHYVGFGVLGLRDMGGYMDQLFPLKAEILSGKRIGPDLVLAGPTLNGEQSAPFHRLVRTEAEARAAVRELKAAGVDFIKIHRQTTREAFFGIASETKSLGLTFVGHVPLVMGWIEASNAGMRTIEHVQTIFENEQPDPKKFVAEFPNLVKKLGGPYGDTIWATLVKNQTYFDPTMSGYEGSIDKAGAEMATKRRAAFAAMKVLIGRAAKAGVPLLAGTDLLENHGDKLLHELELLVEVGLTPQQALAAATTTPCKALNRAGPGRIAVDAPASLLLVDADPLANIANLRKLSLVVLNGRILDSSELARLREMKIQTTP
jgi:imidazolonepropionase-like amidohydrolase